MRVSSSVKSIPNFLRKNKSTIKKRTLIYIIIMALLFPFVYMNRFEIYRTYLTRYDDWHYSYTEDGIPITDYGYQAGKYVGPQITIRTVTNSAIGYYEQMNEGNSTAGIYFNNTIDWILEKRNVITIPTENGTKTISNWPYEFAIYDIPNGLLSAMVDANAIRALALAYQAYGNSTYLEIADQVAGAFETPVSLGGNLYILDDGTHWYPEIVITSDLIHDYKPPLILNGFLFALHYIYEANLIFNNSRLAHIFNLGVISAAQNLYRYDSAYNWTIYHIDYPMKLASKGYHQIHINLCNFIYDYTNVTIFKDYANKWAQFTNPPSFTWEEIFSPEFINNGLLMVAIIFIPLISLDFTQTILRKYLKKQKIERAE